MPLKIVTAGSAKRRSVRTEYKSASKTLHCNRGGFREGAFLRMRIVRWELSTRRFIAKFLRNDSSQRFREKYFCELPRGIYNDIIADPSP